MKVYNITASFAQRFANHIIDVIFYYILNFILFFAVGVFIKSGVFNIHLESMQFTFIAYLVSFLIFFMYYFSFEYFGKGKTIGKLITKTTVVDADGNSPTLKQIFTRTFCRFIPFDAFSYLSSIPYGWHDSIPKLYVVRDFELNNIRSNDYNIEMIGKE